MALPFTNQLDEATLAKQYDAIRRGEGSGSARSLREAFRAGNFGDDTQSFQGSGVRRAGWRDTSIAPESMPEVDPESRTLLGGRLGEFTTEGGQKQYGYYGDVDVFNRQQLDPWLTKSGFSYAKGPEDADYIKAGLDLPSLWKNPLFKTGQYDFTQKYGYNTGDVYNKGVNDYMSSLGYTQDLGQNFDLRATTTLPGLADTFTKVKDYYGKKSIEDYLSGLGYQELTSSPWKEYTDLVSGQNYAKSGTRDWWTGDVNKFGYGKTYDPNEYLTSVWGTLGGNQITPPTEQYEILTEGGDGQGLERPVWMYGGNAFYDENQAKAAQQAKLQEALSNPAIRGELIAQALTKGRIGVEKQNDYQRDLLFRNKYEQPTRGYFGGDKEANQLTADQLRYVLGAKDINYGDQSLGSVFNKSYDPYQDQWSEYNQSTSKNMLRKKTTTEWDYGNVGAGLGLNNPEWWKNNTRGLDDGKFFVGKDNLNSGPVASAEDWYQREHGRDVSRSFTGLGKLANFALNFVPVVGPLLSTAQRGYVNGGIGLGDVLSFIGGGLAQTGGADGWSGLGKVADSAILGAAGQGLGTLASGGSFGDALKAGAIGGLGGWAGGQAGNFVGNSVNSALQQSLGSNASKVIADALGSTANSLTKGALSGLVSGRGITSDIAKAAGIAGLTGGLGSAAGQSLNAIFNPENDRAMQQNFNTLAKNVAGLGPSYYSGQQRQKQLQQQQQLQQAKLNQLMSRLQPRRV